MRSAKASERRECLVTRRFVQIVFRFACSNTSENDIMTRRDLITGAGVMAFTAASQSRIAGANDRIPVGLIGCGARSRELQPPFQKLNGPLTAVCDVWRTRAEESQAQAPGSKLFDHHR